MARRRKTSPSVLESLSQWWEEKFKLPSNHELFQNSTLFELLADFWEDYYYKNPLEAFRNEKGEVQFSNTGDELIDKWEKELAEGKSPDYLEGFNAEDLEKLENLRTRGRSKHGHIVRGGTLKNAVDSAARDAQAIAAPEKRPPIYKRFSDHDSDE